jgi:dTDP-4-dehydrorhamnose reductase
VKVAVTGAKGMLGRALSARLSALGHQTLPLDLPEHDLLDFPAVQAYLQAAAPDFIYNCAAFTNVDLCETEYASARAVNALAVGNLAGSARTLQIPLLQISTDYVFSGMADKPYLPETPPAPLSAYGRTKAEGELLAQTTDKYFIVRTAWLYGQHGKNFVETIIKLAGTQPVLKVVNDQRGAPTLVDDLVAVLLLFLDCREYGIYHFTNSGETTWYGFAQEFLRLLHIETKLEPCATAEFPRPARRPAYSVLDLTKTRSLFKIAVPDWRDAIARYCQNRKG